MTTPDSHVGFSSDVPFSLYSVDPKQSSLLDLSEESKTFLWHQFMRDVLLAIPRSPADIENVIKGCQLVNEHDPGKVDLKHIDQFRMEYTFDKAIDWYTRDSFFYRALNQVSRMLDSDVIVLFHSIVKDLHAQLKQRQSEQLNNGVLKLPFTVYRGQKDLGVGELKKLQENIGGLISTPTFLSTTNDCPFAYSLIDGADREQAVFFQITVNETEGRKRANTFANITQRSHLEGEEEVLFGISSIFRIESVKQEDCFWYVKLELTISEADQFVETFTSEVKTYLNQHSGERMPSILFNQFLTTDSLTDARPFIQLIRFFLSETMQLYLLETYKKDGRMKELLENTPDLLALVKTTDQDMNKIIRPTFDVFNRFLNLGETETIVESNDGRSLLCFGGFLLLTGDLLKGTRYFKMLLANDAIDEQLTFFIHGLLGATQVINKEKELALKSIEMAKESLQPSAAVPSWFPTFVAASEMDLEDPNQRSDAMANRLEPLFHQEESNDTVHEKLRLLNLGHICFEEEKFIDALNYWEEAAEVESHMPSSVERSYNAAVYIQMAAAYFRLNNKSEALTIFEKAINSLECYYPATHRMFATLNFLHGNYLVQNNRPSEAVTFLKKSLANPHFSTNGEFCALTLTLLASASIQSGELDSAELYCQQALTYPATTITAQISELLRAIPEFKMFVRYMGQDYLRQIVSAGIQFGQQFASQANPHSSSASSLGDESTWPSDRFVAIADHYRHRQDNPNAELFYSKALDKLSGSDSKLMWNIYKKMIRMDKNSDRYQDFFVEQFSKYDDENPDHFSLFATLQIILYKFSLTQNDQKTAFGCLISSVSMATKDLVHHLNIDALDRLFHHESIAEVIDIVTNLMKIYTTDLARYIQEFLSKHGLIDDLAMIVHHATIDWILHQINSKYQNDPGEGRIFRFLDLLLKFLRENITSAKTSTLSFKDQVLQFLGNYHDQTSPWFYLIASLESLCMGDQDSFFINFDRFRFQTLTFERYKELKENLADSFGTIEEDQLYSFLKNIFNTP